MKKEELTPHGWMQRELKKINPSVYQEPEENDETTNIDDTGILMRKNPLLRDKWIEQEQHLMIGKRKVMDKNQIVSKTLNKLAKNDLYSDDGKEVLKLLQEALMAEFQQWDLYYAYKGLLKGFSRDPLISHFEDHATDEEKHIDVLQRYIVAMGEIPTVERRPIPKLKENSIEEIIGIQLQFETEAVELYKKILDGLKESSAPLRIEIENILAVEAEHMHDLQMLLRK